MSDGPISELLDKIHDKKAFVVRQGTGIKYLVALTIVWDLFDQISLTDRQDNIDVTSLEKDEEYICFRRIEAFSLSREVWAASLDTSHWPHSRLPSQGDDCSVSQHSPGSRFRDEGGYCMGE